MDISNLMLTLNLPDYVCIALKTAQDLNVPGFDSCEATITFIQVYKNYHCLCFLLLFIFHLLHIMSACSCTKKLEKLGLTLSPTGKNMVVFEHVLFMKFNSNITVFILLLRLCRWSHGQQKIPNIDLAHTTHQFQWIHRVSFSCGCKMFALQPDSTQESMCPTFLLLLIKEMLHAVPYGYVKLCA